MRHLLAALLAAAALQPLAAQEARPAFAEPNLSPDGRQIAFASGGDIWEVAATGGVAHLLVTDVATEGRPLYSPDGTRLAFTSTRGGSQNVWVLDLASGKVTRLTWAEATEELDAWSPDGKYIYFSSAAGEIGREQDVWRVPAAGGTPLEVSRDRYLAEFQGSPSPDGATLALMARGMSFTQWWRNGHSHIDETELWTRPVAGDAGYRKLLGDGAKHAWPMWSGDGAALWFMSDKSGTENIWTLPAAGGAAQQVTRFTDGRVLFPSLRGTQIVFERDFGVWRLDTASGQAAAVPITLRGASAAEPKRHVALSSFDRLAVSPDGQKLALIAHGELFAVSAKDGGAAQRLTTSVGSEREPLWSSDSRRILYTTERGLDRLLAEVDVATGRETLLTTRGFATVPVYAPDGRSVVYVAGKDELHVVTLPRPGVPASDRMLFKGAVAADDTYGPRPTWSPDGRWIAFPVVDRRSFTNVQVVPAAGGGARPLSFLANGQMGRIAWSPDGKYILFDTGQRTEDSRIVRVDLLPHVPRYREDGFRDLFKPDAPGTPETDTPTDAAPRPVAAKPLPGTRKPAAPAPVAATAIVFEGLRERATVLPIGLSAETPVISPDGKTLVFRAHEREQDNLFTYNLDELADEPPVARQLSSSAKPKPDFQLSGDGKTLFYLDGGTVIATPLEPGKAKPVAASAEMDVDFAAEKQVVFDQAWGALDRNFFDANFNGKDWQALRTRFQPYVAGARTPDELRRVISLMIGELNASHSGIGRPQNGPGSLPTNRVGNLGLRFDRAASEAGGGLVVREVIALGPAAIAGGIRAGSRLTSVNGTPVGAGLNLDALLENQVDKRVVLGIDGVRSVAVRPVSQTTAAGLLYRQWVTDRRALVERLSGGRLGYVHLPDMSAESLNQLYLDLDTQNQAKQGVVVDIRNNTGGFVNGYVLDVFSRKNFLTMTTRDLFGVPSRQALGQRALGLPTVLVTNESSLSDAEDFSEGYRTLGVGRIVGQPTAGWIIYTGPERLIDGSTVRVPSTRIQDNRGQDMEMNPRPVDVAVERPLGEAATGDDAQLAAAVRVLLGGQ